MLRDEHWQCQDFLLQCMPSKHLTESGGWGQVGHDRSEVDLDCRVVLVYPPIKATALVQAQSSRRAAASPSQTMPKSS